MPDTLLHLAVAGLVLVATVPAQAEPTGARLDALTTMLVQDCGSCHGLTMKGGLGPPLTPDILADRDPEVLRQTILDGRPGTAMPPWGPLISPDEASWMIDRLRAGLNHGDTR